MPESNQGRAQTDQSLKVERGKTDSELRKRRDLVEHAADAVLQRARTAADHVLQAARDTADDGGGECTEAVSDERALADDALESERSGADEVVRRERAERKRALASLLRLEREETDQHLLTERGRADEALNTRDLFLAMVSHDLRTLLGGVAMTAELIVRDAPGSAEDAVSRAETIQRFAARMNRLIGDLVDVASIETGKIHLERTRGDLRALLEESVAIFQQSAAAHSIQLTLQPGDPLPPSLFDHDRIVQVVANLIGNAIKFCPKGATISVGAAATPSGEVCVYVTDTGPGIRAENLEVIFGRFWQAGRRDRRGLGLGLYISRCIIEAHGGRIWAESDGSTGSTLSFTLPGA